MTALPSARLYSARAGWTAVFVFLLLYTFAFLDRQILSLLVDPIKSDLGVSDFEISVLQGAAFVLFYSLCGLPIGWAVDRYSRRRIVFLGIIVWSFAAAAGGLARNFWHLLLCRFGVGAGEATLHPAAYSILSDLFPKERLTGAVAVYSTGAAVGSAVSLVLGGLIVGLTNTVPSYTLPLIGEVKPWQLVFIITGLPGLFIAFLVFVIPEPVRRGLLATTKVQDAKVPPGSAFAFMKRQPGFYAAHFAAFSMFALMGAGYSAWAPSYLIRTFDWPVERVGYVLGLLTLICTAGGMLTGGYMADFLVRRGVRDAHFRFYAWMVGIFGAAGVMAMLSRDIVVVLIGLAVVKFISPFIPVAAGALQITTPNEYRGQVSAVFLLVYNGIGWGLGPSVIAALSDFMLGGPQSIGLAMAITFAVLSPVTVLVFILGLKPMRRAVEAAESWAET